MDDPALDTNRRRHFMNTRRIEGCSKTDGFWEFGCAIRDDAVRAFLVRARDYYKQRLASGVA